MLAKAFSDLYGEDPDIVIFASGVSNSAETDQRAFAREEALLESLIGRTTKKIVYFGSCASRSDHESAYMRHKHRMEALVASTPFGLVLRLPQVVGLTQNPHTLTNFLYDRISTGKRFVLWSRAQRNLLDVDDLVPIASLIIDDTSLRSRKYDIASRISHPMPEVAMMFERVLSLTAHYNSVYRGDALRIEADLAWAIAEDIGIDLGQSYSESVIRKYYAHRR